MHLTMQYTIENILSLPLIHSVLSSTSSSAINNDIAGFYMHYAVLNGGIFE